MRDCAKEWLKVMAEFRPALQDYSGEEDGTFWNAGIPQALFDTLESYSVATSIVAAEAFLKQFGWTVVRPLAYTDNTPV
jgi:hypothetical protein